MGLGGMLCPSSPSFLNLITELTGSLECLQHRDPTSYQATRRDDQARYAAHPHPHRRQRLESSPDLPTPLYVHVLTVILSYFGYYGICTFLFCVIISEVALSIFNSNVRAKVRGGEMKTLMSRDSPTGDGCLTPSVNLRE